MERTTSRTLDQADRALSEGELRQKIEAVHAEDQRRVLAGEATTDDMRSFSKHAAQHAVMRIPAAWR